MPDEQILWRSTALGGFVKRLRFLELEALSETGCIFSNGELWEGRYAEMARERKAARLPRGLRGAGRGAEGPRRGGLGRQGRRPSAQTIVRQYAPPPEPEPFFKTPVPPKLGGGLFRRR